MAKVITGLVCIIILIVVSRLLIVRDSKISTPNNLPPIIEMVVPTPIPTSKILQNGGYHTFQTFNNCGPAAMSMALSFYGIEVSQKTLGNELRPYQVKSGVNDDKSVTLAEIAEKSKDYGFSPILRPGGTPEILEKLLALDLPIITRTWTKPNEDIGHFRVIKGYDKNRRVFVQDDSLQGKNLEYSYNDFGVLWEKFNYEYLVLVPEEKLKEVAVILGEDFDINRSWQNAVTTLSKQVELDQDNIYKRFNLAVAYFHIKDYRSTVSEFEKVESRLPFRTLWYQAEPIIAYYEVKNYQKVFQITDRIISRGNRAYSELYSIRAKIYENEGNKQKSVEENQKAILYGRPDNWPALYAGQY